MFLLKICDTKISPSPCLLLRLLKRMETLRVVGINLKRLDNFPFYFNCKFITKTIFYDPNFVNGTNSIIFNLHCCCDKYI